jgi:hypothetical protein
MRWPKGVKDDPEGHLRPKPPGALRIEYDPAVPQLELGHERMDVLAYESYKHGFDWEGHARQEDKTARRLARELRLAKAGLAPEVARQATSPAGETPKLVVACPDAVVERLSGILQAAFEYGYQAVWDEREDQTGRERHSEPAGAGSQESVSKAVAMIVTRFVTWISEVAAESAAEGLRAGLRSAELGPQIEHAVTRASRKPVRPVLKEAARQTVLAGRMQAMRELQGEIIDYERVEVTEGGREGRACPRCEAGHGTRWQRLEDITWRPGDDCERGKECRGRLVVNFRSERAKNRASVNSVENRRGIC